MTSPATDPADSATSPEAATAPADPAEAATPPAGPAEAATAPADAAEAAPAREAAAEKPASARGHRRHHRDETAGTGPAGADSPPALTTDVVPGPGGVMTDEVGVITGELTLRTETGAGGAVVVRVQYKEAEEWYTVTGGRITVHDPADAAAVHQLAVALLNRPEEE
jgi:hypothetical protein